MAGLGQFWVQITDFKGKIFHNLGKAFRIRQPGAVLQKNRASEGDRSVGGALAMAYMQALEAASGQGEFRTPSQNS